MKLVAAHQVRAAFSAPKAAVAEELARSMTCGDTQTLRRLAGARMQWLGRAVSAGTLADMAEERELRFVEGSARAVAGWELGALADELADELFDGPVQATDTVALVDLCMGDDVFTVGVIVGGDVPPIRRVFDPTRVKELMDAI